MPFHAGAKSRRPHTRLMSAVCLFVLIGYLGVAMYAGILYLPHHDDAAFVTLDVCHAGSSAIYSNTDMPFLYGCPCKPTAPGFCCFAVVIDPAFNPLMIAYKKDRPPRA